MKKKIMLYGLLIIEILIIIAGIIIYPKFFQAKAWGEEIAKTVNSPFIIYFNQPMIANTIEKNLDITPAISISKYDWEDHNRKLLLTPASVLKSNTVYQINIKNGRSFIGTRIKNKYLAFSTENEKTLPKELPLAKQTEKRIEIDISSQRLKTWQNGKILGEFVISTGKRTTPTKIGNFKVLSKIPMAYGCGYGQCWDMPFWMGIYEVTGQENGIHELPFINGYRENSSSLGYPVSHGCVRLPVGIAEKIYNWAEIGIPVEVHW